MGSFTYDGLTVQIDDRTLAHLQTVIVQKLRRNESFLLSWRDSNDVGDGRSAVWLHPSIPLRFKFVTGHAPAINQEWLAQLTNSANSARGLIITEEDGTLQGSNSADTGRGRQGELVTEGRRA